MGSVTKTVGREKKCDGCLWPVGGLVKNASGEHLCASCRATIEVAQILIEREVADEAQIIPTFAFASCALEMPTASSFNTSFLEVGKGSTAEADLKAKFHNAFGSLEAQGMVDGILLVHQVPLRARVHYPRTVGDPPEKIAIDVYSKSVKGVHVEDYYERALRTAGLSHDPLGRGWIGTEYHPYSMLRLVAVPNSWNGWHAWGGMPVRVASSQDRLFFPTPKLVRITFEEHKRLISGDFPGRTRGKQPDWKLLIQACFAFYIRGRDRLIEDPRLRRTAADGAVRDSVVRMLNNHLRPHLGMDTLFSKTSDEAKAVWESVRHHSPQITTVDDEIRNCCSILGGMQKFS
jgi:hypothetical protein